jgi:hypothetical protein
VLREHWLTSVECLHDVKQDVAHCYCTVWASEPQPNVGAAVESWINHVTSHLGETPTRQPHCDCYTLRIRLNDLRSEQREIAALFGIEPCYDDTPHSWSVGDTGNVSLLALMRGVASRLSSSPSSTTATPDTLHPADEAMLQSYATRQIGEGMPGMVQDASKLARYAIILRMQLSAMSALPSSRALSEEARQDLGEAIERYADAKSRHDHESNHLMDYWRQGQEDAARIALDKARASVAAIIDRLTGAPK